jgi:hypothetical protein
MRYIMVVWQKREGAAALKIYGTDSVFAFIIMPYGTWTI